MACWKQDDGNEESKQNKRIEEYLHAERQARNTLYTVLMIKNSFPRLIQKRHYDESALQASKAVIANNIITTMKGLLVHAGMLGYHLSPTNEGNAKLVACIPFEKESEITKEIGGCIESLWRDYAIKQTFKERMLPEWSNVNYYFDDIARISSVNYVPTNDDAVIANRKCAGMIETVMEVENYKLLLLEIGEQRTEREKYLHCFSDVTAILFTCSISDYDHSYAEDDNKNRLHVMLERFGEVCNSRWFSTAIIVLFLSKRDLFEEKIRKVPLTVCFPEYKGPPNAYEQAVKYIKDRFLEKNTSFQRPVFVKLTCATDTDKFSFVLKAIDESTAYRLELAANSNRRS